MSLAELLRILANASTAADVLPHVTSSALELVGARAAAIVELEPGGAAKLVACSGLSSQMMGWTRGDVDIVDAELGRMVMQEAGGGFADARTVPLVSGRDLFGALVLLYAGEPPDDVETREITHELADIAALAFGHELERGQLSKSSAELSATRDTLERTEKLRALGEMAAGISHDLKNILNPLSLHLQLLRRAVKRGAVADANEAIAEMDTVVRRGVETLDRLRQFSRQVPDERFEPVDLNAIAREAAEIARPRIASSQRSRGIALAVELGQAPVVKGRTAELVSAIVNLVVNAIDILTDGGRIVVSTGTSEGGGWVAVADDGPGMPAEVRAHVFEPFFTTKGKEGTGLGLAMVWSFTQRHGGRVSVDSEPGNGAKFTIWLPQAHPS